MRCLVYTSVTESCRQILVPIVYEMYIIETHIASVDQFLISVEVLVSWDFDLVLLLDLDRKVRIIFFNKLSLQQNDKYTKLVIILFWGRLPMRIKINKNRIILVIPCLFTQYGKIPMDGCCITWSRKAECDTAPIHRYFQYCVRTNRG